LIVSRNISFFAARIAAMEAANAPQPGPTPSASLLIQPAAPGLVARTFVDSCITSLDQVRALLASPANPSDETSLGVRLSSVKVGKKIFSHIQSFSIHIDP